MKTSVDLSSPEVLAQRLAEKEQQRLATYAIRAEHPRRVVTREERPTLFISGFSKKPIQASMSGNSQENTDCV